MRRPPPTYRLRSGSSLACGSWLVGALGARRDDVIADHRVVLVTCVLEDLIAVVTLPRQLDGPWRGPDHGIVERGAVRQRVRPRAREALREHVLLADRRVVERRRADGVDVRRAALAVEVRRLYDERVAFPAAARVAEPGLRAAVDGLTRDRNDACLVDHLEPNHDVTGRLEDLDAVVVVGRQHRRGQAARDAAV